MALLAARFSERYLRADLTVYSPVAADPRGKTTFASLRKHCVLLELPRHGCSIENRVVKLFKFGRWVCGRKSHSNHGSFS